MKVDSGILLIGCRIRFRPYLWIGLFFGKWGVTLIGEGADKGDDK